MNDNKEARKKLYNILNDLIRVTKKGDIVGFVAGFANCQRDQHTDNSENFWLS